MGNFTKSVTREFGKNTGKWISNKVFGDGHSTPYRRVGSNQQSGYSNQSENRKSRSEMLHEQEMERIEAENRRTEKEQLWLLDSAVLANIDSVVKVKIPCTSEEIISLLSELAIQINANNWQKSDSEEGKIRNKFTDALFEKYKQCVLKLRLINPNDSQLNYFEDILKKKKRTRFFQKNSTLILILSVLFFSLLSIKVLYLYEQNELLPIAIQLWSFILTLIPYVIAIAVLFAIYKVVINGMKKKNALKNQTVVNLQPTKEIIQEAKTDKINIFIDLNENDRIEKQLAVIWEKYKKIVDKNIIDRKPIFSSDAVKDSILYIGVNPSYNALDDTHLISSDDKKSLLYGSLYQIPDAPDYFKALELFAAQMNVGYTHINLLYARENDRDLLLNCDHNFIREQLELTYDTIIKAKPIAIVFFSDYCKDLVFGENRWVSPNISSKGHYILNGTTIPVIFTDDITILTENEKEELKKNIQKII